MAEQAAIGQDVVDLVEALRIDQCALSGFDWGLRAACITSILHPEMVKGFVAAVWLDGSGSPDWVATHWPLAQ
ncbi:hypothetical protein [Candidatus Entotheonella palauensis]|uniref:AB hydrolase-1 domain-containing protein n=1 Tax=Candidatus Entotheonella gemina TaxID=1429439 RepID=W4LAL3_9BACT|nr:hypothetical protein [Candidatus Entotheonella palauensis]ETW95042.1 MAG: hypothetical protein ETSY2_48710 [Candidatus Entotheonella gemina]